MYKHLFLEGESGAGKSTLIKECLCSHIDKVGGFSVQRLLDSNNNTVAFRLAAAENLNTAVPYDHGADNIFRSFLGGAGTKNFPEVFETEGVRLLELAKEKNKELILLDEIGGLELQVEAFHEKLLEILSGDTPCIGVIKQLKKAGSMDSGKRKNEIPISVHNRLLREKMLKEFDCKIIDFKRNDPAVKNEVNDFISQILF